MGNIYAAGKLILFNNDRLHVGRLSGVTIASETETAEADAFPYSPGPLQSVDAAKTKETYTATFRKQSFDKLDLGLSFDRIAATIASLPLPETQAFTVPSSSPYEVTVSGLSVDEATMTASLLDDTGNSYLEQIPNADVLTVAAGEFVAASGKLVFHSSAAGKSGVYNYLKTATNISGMGGPLAIQQYGTLAFYGLARTTRGDVQIYLPRLIRLSGTNFELGTDYEEEQEWRVAVPAGWNSPFLLW